MRVVFMGTPHLASLVLDELAKHHEVVGVFTRPDAVRGRGKKLVASPVKERAQELGLTVHEANSLKGEEAVALVESLEPDVICVAAYGCLLPKAILEIPRFGCLNVHTSLLPRWRGAAPIERAILAGDEETGVCIMRMEEGLDTGPYCTCEPVSVGESYLSDMTAHLGQLGAQALVDALERVESGTAEWVEQSEDGLVYADKIAKGELDFAPEDPVRLICAKVRVSNESHPSKIAVAGKTIAVEQAQAVCLSDAPAASEIKAGEVAFIAKKLVIGAADGAVELQRVKPDGKKSMEGRAFAAGLQGIKNKNVTWGRA